MMHTSWRQRRYLAATNQLSRAFDLIYAHHKDASDQVSWPLLDAIDRAQDAAGDLHDVIVNNLDAPPALLAQVTKGLRLCLGSAVVMDARNTQTAITTLRAIDDDLVYEKFRYMSGASAGGAVKISRRTECATHLAVRMLPPAQRARYRQEFRAELAELPRIDQAPYAFRLVSHAWWLRRELEGKATSASACMTTGILTVGGSIACQVVIGWPAAILGGIAILTLAWTISSADRTGRLATLIHSVRGGSESKKKD
jgi:hypothetical protein